MKETQIEKLRKIPEITWADAISKCYTHVKLQLWNKTASGAHCEQRLGMSAADYYVGKAIESLYSGTWEWKYLQYAIDEQLIRIIDSMISEQVRKYLVEMRQGKKTTLVGNEQLLLEMDDHLFETDDDENHLQQLNQALDKACDKEQYKEFVRLKQQGFSYKDICKQMNCTKAEAYQMMETIARRAKKILLTQ